MGKDLPKNLFETKLGKILLADAIGFLRSVPKSSVDLIFTSPPFDLIREKKYGNLKGKEYQAWMKEFGAECFKCLKPTGSLVLDLGGGWTKGQPTKNLYEYRLLLSFVDDLNFHLAQDFFWWDPSKLPTPAQWVNIERVRAKDAVNKIWWFSKTERPKANNTKILQRYSKSMEKVLEYGTNTGTRASGHEISSNFHINNGGSIPPNLIALANVKRDDEYIKYCKENKLDIHPARFDKLLPEYFIRFLTEKNDLVIDPFAGSCTTAHAAENLERRWICTDLNENYLLGGIGRLTENKNEYFKGTQKPRKYSIYAPEFIDGKLDETEEAQMELFFSENSKC